MGSIIAAMAGKYLKPIITELGGKASAIILADADIKRAAVACAMGSFQHAGQVCMSTERIIVHKAIVDDFIMALKQSTEQMYGQQGRSPVLVTATGANKTKRLVKAAINGGAEVILGDPTESLYPDETSTVMKPIILTNVRKGNALYEDESFGPSVDRKSVV